MAKFSASEWPSVRVTDRIRGVRNSRPIHCVFFVGGVEVFSEEVVVASGGVGASQALSRMQVVKSAKSFDRWRVVGMRNSP